MSASIAFFLLLFLFSRIGPSIHPRVHTRVRREATAPRVREAGGDDGQGKLATETSIGHRKRVGGGERGGREHLTWDPQLVSQFGLAKFGH
uniref:Secreted protein n=1 Tax=Oryza glumipatula TaxID=40148 RepID=A0A0D9YPP2_9ORYZ